MNAEDLPYLSPLVSVESTPSVFSIHTLPEGPLGETNAVKQNVDMTIEFVLCLNLSDSSHLADLVQCFHDLCDWMKLGVFLGIPYPTLKKVEVDEQGLDNHKMAMFHHWLSTGSANKATLLTALSKMDNHS